MSFATVLAFYRRLLTAADRDAQPDITIDTDWAGWVAGPLDGRAGIATIRQRLLDAVTHTTDLTGNERAVIGAHFGLDRWPDQGHQRLRRQVRSAADRPVSSQWTATLRRDALAVLERTVPARPAAGPVTTSLTGPPHVEAGIDVPAADTAEQAVWRAVTFVSAAGPDRKALAVIAEIHRWHAATREVTPRGAGSTSRARAVVALGLADQTLPAVPPLAAMAVRPDRSLEVADPPVDRFLHGAADPDTLSAVVDAIRRGQVDRQLRRPLADMLLHVAVGRARRQDGPQPAEVAAILQLCARQRARADDLTAISLAMAISPRHRAVAISTLQAVVTVASAHQLWGLADRLVARSLQLIDLPGPITPGLDVTLDRDEFRLWGLHQKTATLRRRLEVGDVTADRLRDAQRLTEGTLELLDTCLDRARSAAGDVQPAWRYFLAVRRAELAVLAGQPDTARRAVADAGSVTPTDPADQVHARKAELELAVLDGNLDGAAQLLWDVHAAGWPLERTSRSVIARLAGHDDDPLAAAVGAVAAAQADPGWVPAVDGRQRRAALGLHAGFTFRAGHRRR